MARPRSFDAEAFLDHAMDVFWRRGFAATSMTDIYEATGLGASSIYAFVKDKNALFRAVFERYSAGFRQSLPTDVTGAAAIEQWMRGFANGLADDPVRKGCLIANTIMEPIAHTQETLDMAQSLVDEVRSWLQQQIACGQEQGDYRKDVDPAAASNVLAATILGMMAMARAQSSRESLVQIAENAAKGLIRQG